MEKKEKLEINITLNENTQIYNPFSENKLSDNLSEYIYSQCKGTPTKAKITLNINHHVKLNDEEKNQMIDSIRENYGVDIKENLIKLRFEHAKELLMLTIGTIFIIISSLLNSFVSPIVGEIISIFGCVIIWEIAYNIFFVETGIRIKNKRLKNLTEAKINFNYIPKKEK